MWSKPVLVAAAAACLLFNNVFALGKFGQRKHTHKERREETLHTMGKRATNTTNSTTTAPKYRYYNDFTACMY